MLTNSLRRATSNRNGIVSGHHSPFAAPLRSMNSFNAVAEIRHWRRSVLMAGNFLS